MSRPRTGPSRYAVPALVILACSAALLFAALTRPPEAGGPPEAAAGGVSPRYRQFCASCHGLDGLGYGAAAFDSHKREFIGELGVHRPADLTCPAVSSFTRGQLEQVVRGGIACREHGQVMPAFPDLTEAQFAEIAEQLRAFGRMHGPGEQGDHEGHDRP